MFKVDLHTHSVRSPDGGLSRTDYIDALKNGTLDYIAITDHNAIEFAQELHAELGSQIIIGEEITAREGELIGLYLKSVVPPGLSVAETADRIRKQGGLVYVPHPFESVRKGLSLKELEEIVESVDIVEVHNGRAIFQDRSMQALDWAKLYELPGAASSDAHGRHGWGRTYSLLAKVPTRENLNELLYGGKYEVGPPGLRGALYPKVNRVRKRFGHA